MWNVDFTKRHKSRRGLSGKKKGARRSKNGGQEMLMGVKMIKASNMHI
jgi:hypothetical protein